MNSKVEVYQTEETLDEEDVPKGGSGVPGKLNKIAKARRVMREALDNDEGLKIAYVANIAMLLSDRYGITKSIERNSAAEDILKLLFSD